MSASQHFRVSSVPALFGTDFLAEIGAPLGQIGGQLFGQAGQLGSLVSRIARYLAVSRQFPEEDGQSGRVQASPSRRIFSRKRHSGSKTTSTRRPRRSASRLVNW